MPSKASAGNGDKDVYPQFLNLTVTETGANTFTSKEYSTPNIGITGSPSGVPVIMEILKLYIDSSTPELIAATTTLIQYAVTKQVQTAIPNLSDVDVVYKGGKTVVAVGARTSEATGVVQTFLRTEVVDLEDANGKGYLYPFSKIYISIAGTGNTQAKRVDIKILYRMKTVTAEELLGLTSESSG